MLSVPYFRNVEIGAQGPVTLEATKIRRAVTSLAVGGSRH